MLYIGISRLLRKLKRPHCAGQTSFNAGHMSVAANSQHAAERRKLLDMAEPLNTHSAQIASYEPPRKSPTPTNSRSSIFTLVRLIVVVIALGAGGTSTWFLMTSSSESPATVFNSSTLGFNFYPNRPNYTRVLSIQPNGIPVDASAIYNDGLPIYLTFEIDTFDPSSGTTEGRINATLGPEWFYQQPISGHAPSVPELVYVNGIPIRMARSAERCDVCPPIASGSVAYSMQAVGSSAAFPSDSYAIDQAVTVDDQQSGSPRGATEISIQAGPRLNPYQIEAHKTDNTFEISILLRRNTRQTVWSYVIALAPILLIFVLAWQLVTGSPRVTLEAGIGILAILPLRQVLVPTDVGGITGVDLVLGMELVAIILLVAIGAFTRTKSAPTPT